MILQPLGMTNSTTGQSKSNGEPVTASASSKDALPTHAFLREIVIWPGLTKNQQLLSSCKKVAVCRYRSGFTTDFCVPRWRAISFAIAPGFDLRNLSISAIINRFNHLISLAPSLLAELYGKHGRHCSCVTLCRPRTIVAYRQPHQKILRVNLERHPPKSLPDTVEARHAFRPI